MPHLSPMSWILSPITFISLLIMFISITWWQQTYSFPKMNISTTSTQPKWNWN
uniref:ATP synthase F0 subunit 8 n=1 Tax=Glycera cf. oxycephala FS21 TaxID=1763831 RepID=A0A0U2VSD0_9ANNE|nr:ATP synthase F0 subunit 8 [Glycera cf. oxycephala FS21]